MAARRSRSKQHALVSAFMAMWYANKERNRQKQVLADVRRAILSNKTQGV